MLAIKHPDDFRIFPVCFGNMLAKETAEDSAETFVHYVRNGFGIPRHYAKGSDSVFSQLRLFFLPTLYYLCLMFPLFISLLWFLHASSL